MMGISGMTCHKIVFLVCGTVGCSVFPSVPSLGSCGIRVGVSGGIWTIVSGRGTSQLLSHTIVDLEGFAGSGSVLNVP